MKEYEPEGIILQDYSTQNGYTTWLAFPETARTQPGMNHTKVTAAFRERFRHAPEVVRCLPGHWRAGPLIEQLKEMSE